MKNPILLFLSFITLNVSSTFSQGILAGQITSNMTYYDFPDDTLQAIPAGHLQNTSDAFSLDINQDGIFDISFGCSKSSANGGSTNSGHVSIINQQGAIFTKIDSFLYFNQWYTTRGSKPYKLNDSITGPSFNYFEYLWSANSSNQGPITYFHLWDTIGESYIGFNISVNNQSYYGWIRGELYSDGQSSQKDAFIIKDLAYQSFPVGIEEGRNSNIQIYPNPVKQYLNINGLNKSEKPIQILDITGKVVLEKRFNQNRINLSQLNSGIYFIKIQTGESFEIKKIFKQ